MNKKRLSVVMAGAMLATSVAPVLAAETTVTTKEYTVAQKELLVKYLENKLKEKEFTNNSVLADDATGAKYLGDAIATKLEGFGTDAYKRSVYEIKINGVVADGTSNKKIEDLVKNLTVGQKVEIFEKENTTFLGQVIPAKKAPEAVAENSKTVYTKAELTAGKSNSNFDDTTASPVGLKKQFEDNRFVESATLKETGKATIKLKALENINNTNSNISFDITTGDVKYDLNLPVDADGNLLDISNKDDAEGNDLQKCAKFLKDSTWAGGYATDAEPVKVETIDMVAVAPTEEVVNYNVDDLYDGTLLTEKGTELLNDIKNDGTKGRVVLSTATFPNAVNGITTFEVQYKSKDKSSIIKRVVIKSSERKNIEAVHDMFVAKAYKVGIVAGQNRYETAVNVAKEAGVKKLVKPTGSNTDAGEVSNIVLVNGNSLVDGLAAAPLSNYLSVKSKNIIAAPLLLTKTDSLPEETKDFLNELTEDVPKNELKDITINLVGGNSVLSESLVKELKGMGFSVVRFGGDDREETSVKVAKAISSANNAFVVGANGEADAMSISAQAFTSTTPIIVSSVHGLTADGLEFLGNQTGNATIIGGEKAITTAEEEKIKEVKEDKDGGVKRIAGANRIETNAKILKEFMGAGLAGKKVTIVKDGSNNKTELVDALSAANLGGPIVLANSELSNEQLRILVDKKDNVAGSKLLQVGLGLNDSIIKSLSKALEITNITK